MTLENLEITGGLAADDGSVANTSGDADGGGIMFGDDIPVGDVPRERRSPDAHQCGRDRQQAVCARVRP